MIEPFKVQNKRLRKVNQLHFVFLNVLTSLIFWDQICKCMSEATIISENTIISLYGRSAHFITIFVHDLVQNAIRAESPWIFSFTAGISLFSKRATRLFLGARWFGVWATDRMICEFCDFPVPVPVFLGATSHEDLWFQSGFSDNFTSFHLSL